MTLVSSLLRDLKLYCIEMAQTNSNFVACKIKTVSQ